MPRVPHPTRLDCLATFTKQQLPLPGDTRYLTIVGMAANCDELLVFADLLNRRVTLLWTSKGALALIFAEADTGWLVSNCVLPDGPHGDSMLVTERVDREVLGGRDTRVVVTRRAVGGSFLTTQVLPLTEPSGGYV